MIQSKTILKSRFLQIFLFFLLFTGAIVVLLPLIIIFLTSLAKTNVTNSHIKFNNFTWNNYQEAWEQSKFIIAFANSTIISLAVTGLQILTSAFAGYALSKLKFSGKKVVLTIVITTLIIPFQILVIPIFIVLKWSSLINTYWALILPTAANGFGIFLMRQYFANIPVEIEEAAILDGANRWQLLVNIMLPLSRPGLITLFIFTFIAEWNDLFKPLVFTTRPELITTQLVLASFQEEFTSNWPLMMAAIVISTIPVIALFLYGQKYLIQGLSSTGIKG